MGKPEINEIASDDLYSRIARRYCRYAGLDWGRHADDLISMVKAEALRLLAEIAAGDPDALACVSDIEASLFVRCHSAIRAYADSVGLPVVKRGQRALVRHQRRIHEAGVEPASP